MEFEWCIVKFEDKFYGPFTSFEQADYWGSTQGIYQEIIFLQTPKDGKLGLTP